MPVMWDEKSGTLLYVDTLDNVDRNGQNLEVNMGLMSRFACFVYCANSHVISYGGRYPRAKLSASLQDSHVYVFRRAVLDLLNEKPNFESLQGEFIPWLCTLQHHRGKRAKHKDGVSALMRDDVVFTGHSRILCLQP